MNATQFLLSIGLCQKAMEHIGVFSVCSANAYVLKASILFAREYGSPVVIEATCNQVNQYGGYTGMKPGDFKSFVASIAKANNASLDRVILGGDHLGPNPWKHLPATQAMTKARELVAAFVDAGFTKIHIDASMALGNDEDVLPPRLIAARTAELIETAENVFQQKESAEPPVYVIGTEVPAPGGTESSEEGLQVTSPQDLEETIALTKKALFDRGLSGVWERVMAVVVQPGVEFGNEYVHQYDSKKAQALVSKMDSYLPIVLEGHSTDYQQPEGLKQLVHDRVGVLKVGPELTFALREGLFALENMEKEMFVGKPELWSNLSKTLDTAMLRNPKHWEAYYVGSVEHQAFSRRFGLSDRCRYYWGEKNVENSVQRLLDNMGSRDIPLPLLSQYMPRQYSAVRNGVLDCEPEALVLDFIQKVLRKYAWATRQEEGVGHDKTTSAVS